MTESERHAYNRAIVDAMAIAERFAVDVPVGVVAARQVRDLIGILYRSPEKEPTP